MKINCSTGLLRISTLMITMMKKRNVCFEPLIDTSLTFSKPISLIFPHVVNKCHI